MKKRMPILIVCIVIVLSLIQLLISHSLATDGEKLRQVEERTSQLEQENKVLQGEINKDASLARIAQRAQDLGLVKTTTVLHLTPQIPVALK
jgi:cell division protein FtsL